MKSTMKLDGIAMIIRVLVWQKGYFRHKQRNTSCIVIVDLKSHTKRRRAFIMYEVENLNFSYGEIAAIKELSLSLTSGHFWAIVGPNGCGKTTLIDLLCAIKKPDKGRIVLFDKDVYRYSRKELSRMIAVVPQEFYINFPFTVRDIVLMGRHPYLGRFSPPSQEDYDMVDEIMDMLGIYHLKNKMITDLSGGEKQRAVLARALVQDTTVLLLDEPTANLDIRHAFDVFKVLCRFILNKKITVIAAIHDLNLAAYFCDMMVFMKNGSLISYGKLDDVFNEENIARTFDVDCRVYFEPYSGKRKVSFKG